MLLIFAIALIILSIFLVSKFKSFIAPNVIISFIWGVIFLGYSIIPHGMFSISDKTIFILFIWVTCSITFATFFSSIKLKETKVKDLYFNQAIRNIYLIITIITFVPLMYIAYKQGTTMDAGSFLFNLRMANTGIVKTEYTYGIFQYGFAFAMVSFLIEVYSSQKINKKIVLLFIINILLAVITMAKTSFFFLFISLFIVNAIKYKYSIKKIIPIALFIATFMILIQLLRADSESSDIISNMFNVYIFGGIPALNEIVNADTHTVQFGEATLRFFYVIFGKSSMLRSDFINNIFEKGGYVYIPYPTNVYTVIYPYWIDFGIIGVIIGAILNGAFVGLVYKLAIKNRPWAITLYAYLAAVLVLPFFGEYLVTNLSYTIQLVLLLYIANKFNYKFTFQSNKNES